MTSSGGYVGLFDSGVGGLTVVHALLRRFPGQSVLYLADQAHVPYGDRSTAEVRAFALEITRFLIRSGCDAIVMACNISSATALDAAEKAYRPRPVVGVIRPAVRAALRAPQPDPPRIGILATRGTVETGAYVHELSCGCPRATITQVACPALVPLIEAGELAGPRVHAACREYLEPLARAGCTTVILGCTHYPLLLPVLEDVASDVFERKPVFIDPADAVVDDLIARKRLTACSTAGERRLLTTGKRAVFALQVRRFLDADHVTVGRASWDGGTLTA